MVYAIFLFFSELPRKSMKLIRVWFYRFWTHSTGKAVITIDLNILNNLMLIIKYINLLRNRTYRTKIWYKTELYRQLEKIWLVFFYYISLESAYLDWNTVKTNICLSLHSECVFIDLNVGRDECYICIVHNQK